MPRTPHTVTGRSVFVFLLSVFIHSVFPHTVAAQTTGAAEPGTTSTRINKVIAKLELDRVCTGIFVFSLDVYNAWGLLSYNEYPDSEENLTRPMIDFAIIDLEHSPYDIARLQTFLLALNSKAGTLNRNSLQHSVTPFVRIPDDGDQPVQASIKQVLDLGAHGIVVPHVRNAEEALKISRACRYGRPTGSAVPEPTGARGYSPKIAPLLWGLPSLEYYRRADLWPLNPDGELMLILMIEDNEGVENVDSILKTPGIGAIFFGPADYSVDSGNMGGDLAEVDEAFERVKRACETAGVPMIAFADPDNVKERIADGFKMLVIGRDVDYSGQPHPTLEILRQD